MRRFEIKTPFGVVFLEATTREQSALRMIRPDETVTPGLLPGQRIDACRISTVAVRLDAGEVLDLTLGCNPASGVEVGSAAGQYLHACKTTGPFCSGAFAMRDDISLATRLHCDAVFLGAPGPSQTIRLTARRAVAGEVQFAACWTFDPVGEEEQDASWFAVDMALAS